MKTLKYLLCASLIQFATTQSMARFHFAASSEPTRTNLHDPLSKQIPILRNAITLYSNSNGEHIKELNLPILPQEQHD
jgi:hypothetical protein